MGFGWEVSVFCDVILGEERVMIRYLEKLSDNNR